VDAGVAIASGLHWYLKYYCNASIAWGKGGSGNQLATVPSANNLPMPAAQRNVSPVRVRYAYNVSRRQIPDTTGRGGLRTEACVGVWTIGCQYGCAGGAPGWPRPILVGLTAVTARLLCMGLQVCTFGYTMYAWTFDRSAAPPSNVTSPACPPAQEAGLPESGAAPAAPEAGCGSNGVDGGDGGSVAALPVGSSITWREELDRLALWGINLPLAFNGQEWAVLQAYTSVGLSQADVIDNFLSGPAFLPWQRMGNIQRLDNPGSGVMLGWITAQRDLQLLILQVRLSECDHAGLRRKVGHAASLYRGRV